MTPAVRERARPRISSLSRLKLRHRLGLLSSRAYLQALRQIIDDIAARQLALRTELGELREAVCVLRVQHSLDEDLKIALLAWTANDLDKCARFVARAASRRDDLEEYRLAQLENDKAQLVLDEYVKAFGIEDDDTLSTLRALNRALLATAPQLAHAGSPRRALDLTRAVHREIAALFGASPAAQETHGCVSCRQTAARDRVNGVSRATRPLPPGLSRRLSCDRATTNALRERHPASAQSTAVMGSILERAQSTTRQALTQCLELSRLDAPLSENPDQPERT